MTLLKRLRSLFQWPGRYVGPWWQPHVLPKSNRDACWDAMLAEGEKLAERAEADMKDTTLDDWEEQGGPPPAPAAPWPDDSPLWDTAWKKLPPNCS